MSVDQLTTCQPSDTFSQERTRFFPFQRVGPDDLTQDQVYFREKHRRHNRLLHGWGVVCGVRLRPGPNPCEIIVEPGYVLGPFGDEILIDREVTVDLCREGLDGNAVSPCGDSLDPWCSDVRVDRQANQALYVAVRYAECQTRPVRSVSGSCGCDLSDCEYSRTRDSYAIKVLTRLPSTYSDPMPQPDSESLVSCADNRARTCPDCPSEPWVILADVTLTFDSRVDEIDCFTHRRYVVSFADYYFLCGRGDDRGRPGDVRIRALDLVRRLGRPALLDLRSQPDVTPATSIAVRTRDDAWVTLPVHFTVTVGETYAELLAREGDRQYYDLATDDTYTLREMFALADIDPGQTIANVTQAVAPLEGVRLNVSDLRVVRAGFEDLLDTGGISRWTRDLAGRVDTVTALPANDLKGVNRGSFLGRKLAGMTVAEIAGLDQQSFVNHILEGAAPEDQERLERQTRDVWATARRIQTLQRRWTQE